MSVQKASIERGTVIETRDELSQVCYADEYVVVLRTEASRDNQTYVHRIERRSSFEAMLKEGRMSLMPESELDLLEETRLNWTDVDLIGEATKEALYDNGFETAFDVHRADDDELLDVDGVGQKGLRNLRRFV